MDMDVPKDTVTSLPEELWEVIFGCPQISHTDLCVISLVCGNFRVLCACRQLWRQKFVQRYPRTHLHMVELSNTEDWLNLFKLRHFSCHLLKDHLKSLSERFIWSDKDYIDYDTLTEKITKFVTDTDSDSELQKWKNIFVIEELRCIVSPTDQSILNKNLTARFYAQQVLRVVVHEKMKSDWEEWVQGDQELEKGLFLLAQWFQPELNLEEKVLLQFLDDAAERTKAKIGVNYRNHPILKGRLEDYNTEERMQVVHALNMVFTGVLGLRGNTDDYYNKDNSFWNKVIETRQGIPITLCILYLCVAKRVGVQCYPVNYPSHFLVKVLMDEELPDDWTIIDVFNGCSMKSPFEINQQFAITDSSVFNFTTNKLIITRMCRNIERLSHYCCIEARELLWIIDKCPINMLELVNAYMQLGINHKMVRIVCNPVELEEQSWDANFAAQLKVLIERIDYEEQNPTDQNAQPESKRRSDNGNESVKWGVGMVMQHRRYNYSCVIIGWDNHCNMSTGWKKQMQVASLERGEHQPFYNVLVNDGSSRYAAEDNLLRPANADTIMKIDHLTVDKYFEEFCGTHYIMNEHKLVEYPDDPQVLENLYSN